MKILIVDDEPAIRLTMERMLKQIDGVEIVGCFPDASQTLAFIKEKEADLAFIDIQIASDSGLELARQLRDMSANLDIVFITSHTEFALDAFDAYPLDYMVKPISRQRLMQTIARAAEQRRLLHQSALEQSSNHSNLLSVQGLGCIRATSRKAEEVKWMTRKSQELFVYLLVQRGRSVGKSQMIEDIFPNRSLKSAETYLYTSIYQLRRSLTPHDMKEIVYTANEQYRLDLNQVYVDFIEFEKDAANMPTIREDNIAAALELEKRYTGDLFGEKSYEWSIAERERLAMVHEGFVKRLAHGLIEHDRLPEAGQIVNKMLRYNELDEELNALLLRIYGTLNKRQLLKSHYEHFSALLRRELNTTPSNEIMSIYEKYD